MQRKRHDWTLLHTPSRPSWRDEPSWVAHFRLWRGCWRSLRRASWPQQRSSAAAKVFNFFWRCSSGAVQSQSREQPNPAAAAGYQEGGHKCECIRIGHEPKLRQLHHRQANFSRPCTSGGQEQRPSVVDSCALHLALPSILISSANRLPIVLDANGLVPLIHVSKYSSGFLFLNKTIYVTSPCPINSIPFSAY